MRTTIAFLLLATTMLPQEPPQAEDVIKLNTRGIAANRAGRHEEAVDCFERAIALRQVAKQRVEPILVQNLVRSLVSLAAEEMAEDRLVEARKTLHRARSYAPRDPIVMSWAGILAYRVGQRGAALELLSAALEIDEATVIAHEYSGHVYYARDQLDEAVAAWERAIALDSSRKKYLASALAKARRELEVEAGMQIERSTHFACKYGSRHERSVTREILQWLESAYSEFGAMLHFYPRKRLTVVLYGDREFNIVSGGHEWAAALYDGKIRIPVKNFRIAKKSIAKTLRHEYAHFVVRSLAHDVPGWLNEGFAQIAEGEQSRRVRSRLAKMSREDALIPFGQLRGSFSRIAEQDRVWLAYAQSLSFVTYLIDEHGGVSRVEEFLRMLGRGVATDTAFRRVYRRTVEELEVKWRESL